MDQKLPELVEELTTSGEPQLNPEKMKELKKICKSSEEQLNHAYRLLMTQLTQDHAEIRLSAFQVVDELFTRSHQFRVLLVSDFQEFLELTLGTDHEQPLPPPREAAQQLRQAAMRAVEGWNEKFGEAYKKLALGYHFLRHTKKVDFQDVNARTLAERKREEEKQKHLDKIHRERAELAQREIEEMSEEIRCCLTEVENCFRLLVPLDFGPCPEGEVLNQAFGRTEEGASGSSSLGHTASRQSCASGPQDEEQPCCSRDLPAFMCYSGAAGDGEKPAQTDTRSPSEDEDEGSDPEEFVRSHGLGSHKYTLDVELSSDGLKVQESEDNLAVLHAARDALKLIRNKFLPAACSWVKRFTHAGIHSEHLKHAIDLKIELELALKKYEELDIVPERRQKSRVIFQIGSQALVQDWPGAAIQSSLCLLCSWDYRQKPQRTGRMRTMKTLWRSQRRRGMSLTSPTTCGLSTGWSQRPHCGPRRKTQLHRAFRQGQGQEEMRRHRILPLLLPSHGGSRTTCPQPQLLPGQRWGLRTPRSCQQSGPGHPLCPLEWTCATGARSSQRLGRSSNLTLSTASGSPARWRRK
uniref:UV-stimulated scaffold protein A n=1 Tax=Castor canadensis TaxID=51338 RepID=A0A8B7VMH5_CASCN|nr:UV-stimulated scaffold protein A isoform X2 [Castor canadensis]